MNETITSFTDLNAWKENHKLLLMIYKALTQYPKVEIFALSNQMRQASISITSNIALKEKIPFYYQAQGSLTEIKNRLLLSRDVGYLSEKTFNDLMNLANIGHQLLQGLITKSKSLFVNHIS